MRSLSEILNELYAADPLLRNEPDLPVIVEQLLAARPDIHIDDAFRQRLQRELAEHAHQSQLESSSIISKRSFMPMKWLIALPVVAIAAFFIVPKLQPGPTPGTTGTPSTGVTKTTAQAFGTLSKNMLTPIALSTRESQAGVSNTTATLDTSTTSAPVDLIAKPDVLTTYTYVYAGTDLQLTG